MRFRKLRIAWSVACGYRVRAADRVVGAELLVVDDLRLPVQSSHA